MFNLFQRTEAQLKKCWDNLKTKRKKILCEERRKRMRTGGGPYDGPSTSQDGGMDDALATQTEVEIQYAIDSDFTEPPPSQHISTPPPQELPTEPTIPPTTNQPVAVQYKNIRSQVIHKEFNLRESMYSTKKKREEEIHQLQIAEKKLLLKAAEEKYEKSKLEREAAEINLKAAEELRRCNEALREAAELKLSQKRIGTGVDHISSSGNDYFD